MINFIQQHGKERVKEIEQETTQAFNIEKEKQIEAAKTRMEEKIDKENQAFEVKLKIERSAEMNKLRIDKMRTINNKVEELRRDAKVKLYEKVSGDQDAYKKLLKELLVQGLIKMLEPRLFLKVR